MSTEVQSATEVVDERLPVSVSLQEVFSRLEAERAQLRRVDEELEELLTERERLEERVGQSTALAKQDLARIRDGVLLARDNTLSKKLEISGILDGVKRLDSTHERVNSLLKRVRMMVGLKDTIRQTETSIEDRKFDDACKALSRILRETGSDMREADPVSFQILMDVRQRLEDELTEECTQSRRKRDFASAKHFARLLPQLASDCTVKSDPSFDDSTLMLMSVDHSSSSVELGLNFFCECVMDELRGYVESEGLLRVQSSGGLTSGAVSRPHGLPHVRMVQQMIDYVFYVLNENSALISQEFGDGFELRLCQMVYEFVDESLTLLLQNFRTQSNVTRILEFSNHFRDTVNHAGSDGLMAVFKHGTGLVNSGQRSSSSMSGVTRVSDLSGVGAVAASAVGTGSSSGAGFTDEALAIERLMKDGCPVSTAELIAKVIEIAVLCRELESYDVSMRGLVNECGEVLMSQQNNPSMKQTEGSDVNPSLSLSSAAWKSWRMPRVTKLAEQRQILMGDYIQCEMLSLQLQCVDVLMDEMSEIISCAQSSIEADRLYQENLRISGAARDARASSASASSSVSSSSSRYTSLISEASHGSDLKSPASANVFYILKQTGQRVINTYDIGGICALINNFSNLIEILVKEWFDYVLRLQPGQKDKSFAAHLWHESSSTFSMAALSKSVSNANLRLTGAVNPAHSVVSSAVDGIASSSSITSPASSSSSSAASSSAIVALGAGGTPLNAQQLLGERMTAIILNDCDECLINLFVLRKDLEGFLEQEFGKGDSDNAGADGPSSSSTGINNNNNNNNNSGSTGGSSGMNEKERFKIRDCLRQMVDTGKSFERVIERGLSRFVQNYEEQIVNASLQRLNTFSYLLTEAQFMSVSTVPSAAAASSSSSSATAASASIGGGSSSMGEPFVNTVQRVLSPILLQMRRLFTVNNFDRILNNMLSLIIEQIELEIVTHKKYTFWGAMQFDKDRQQLESFFTEQQQMVSGSGRSSSYSTLLSSVSTTSGISASSASKSGSTVKSVREQFGRLRLIGRILQCSRIEEAAKVISEVYGIVISGADSSQLRRARDLSVTLSVPDMLKFLSLRVEFTAEQINQLSSQFSQWI